MFALCLYRPTPNIYRVQDKSTNRGPQFTSHTHPIILPPMITWGGTSQAYLGHAT